MYEEPGFAVLTERVPVSKAAEAAGYSDTKNVRNQIDRYLREGKVLPRRLKERLVVSQPTLHEEVRLHTYSPRLLRAVLTLRALEDATRPMLRALDASATADEVRREFEEATSDVLAVFLDTVNEGKRLEQAEARLSEEERTTLYLAASVNHLLTILWDDGAKAMAKTPAESPEDRILDFVELDGSIIDVAEQAYCNYATLEFELGGGPGRPGLEPHDLAQQDREIVTMNMASISSFALDWARWSAEYIPIMGIGIREPDERISRLASDGKNALPGAVDLMKRFEKHVLVARNVAYMALQHDAAEELGLAADQIAAQHGVGRSEVWNLRIAGREPIASERNLHDRFVDGQPKVLTRKDVK